MSCRITLLCGLTFFTWAKAAAEEAALVQAQPQVLPSEHVLRSADDRLQLVVLGVDANGERRSHARTACPHACHRMSPISLP